MQKYIQTMRRERMTLRRTEANRAYMAGEPMEWLEPERILSELLQEHQAEDLKRAYAEIEHMFGRTI